MVGTDGSTGKITIAAQATDEDDDPLTYTTAALWGNVVRNEDGTFTYTPTATARHLAATLLGAKTDTVTIWANDGRGGITLLPTSVTVDIVSANGAPVVTVDPDTFTEPILGTISGSLDIDDPDGDLVMVAPTGLSTRGGLVTVIGHTYTYTPTLGVRGQGGTDTFTLSVNDLHGSTTEVTVTVTIAQINVAPVFETAPTITDTDHTTGVLTGTFKVRDDNGDALTFTSLGVLGTIAVNTTPAADGVTYTFTYTPYNAHAASLPGAITTDLVTITAWDGGLLSGDSETFVVHLSTQVNQTPSASYQNTGGSSLLGTVTGEIVVSDDDLLHSYTPVLFSTDKGSVIVSALTGHYTYTASIEARNAASATNASAADKIDTFTITVTDPAGASVDVLVTVDIPQWNLPPAGGVASNIVADDNGLVRGHISGVINLDGDPLSYSIAGANGASTAYTGEGGIAHVDTDGNYIYIPRLGGALGYYDSFSVTVSDGRGGTTDVIVGLGALIAPTSPLKNVDVSQTNTGPGVVTGSVSLGSAANNGLFSSFGGTGAGHGIVSFDGVDYTYTRTSTGHVGGTTDTFDIVGTAYGLTVTVATVTVTPTISNVAPTAGTTTITESSVTGLGLYTHTAKGQVVAFDGDGDPVTYPGGSIIPALIGTANGGTVSFYEDGSFNYTILARLASYFHAAANTNATGNAVNDTFDITVTDSFGASTTITVSVPIPKWNEAPSANVSVGGKTVDALGVVRGALNGSDDEDDDLTYTLVGGSNGVAATTNGGIVRFTGNSFTYIPTAGEATDSFQVLINDGHGGITQATVNLSALTTPSPTTNINTATQNVVTGQLNTAGNTGLTYSVGSQGAKGQVAVTSTGAFTYERNAALGHSETPHDTFTITATDVNGNSVTIATITVTPSVANSAPAGTGVTTDGPVGSPTYNVWGGPSDEQNTTGTLHASDADGDPLTFAAGTYSTANGGSVTVTTSGAFSYSLTKFAPFGVHNSYWHDAAATGAAGDTFTVNVTDGFGGTTAVTYSVPIATLNEVPDASVSVGNKTTDALGVVRGTVTGSDDDGDTMTYSLAGATGGSVSTANGGIVQFSGNSFTYIPTKDVSSDSFQVLVNDGHGGISTATVNLSGLATPSPLAGAANTSTPNVVTGQLNTTGNTTGWTYSLGADGTKIGTATVVSSTGAFTYTRDAALGHTTSPTDSFTIRATETATGRSVIIATINVTPAVPNAAPAAAGVSVTTSTGPTEINLGTQKRQTTTGTLLATDANNDAVTFTAGTYNTANGGEVTVTSAGVFNYTIVKWTSTLFYPSEAAYWHNSAADGTPGDTFSITVNDGFGGPTTLSFAIPIRTENSLPSTSVTVSNKTTDVLGVVRGSVAGSDGDGDGLSYSVAGATGGSVSTANGGIVQFSGNSFTYIPTNGVSSDSFQVLVNDGHGGISTATVNLSGLATPSPLAGAVNTSTPNVVTGQLNTTGNTTGWTYSLGADGTKIDTATVVSSTGAFTYTRDADLGHSTSPTDSFTIRATEIATGRSVIIATISVEPSVPNTAPTATLTTAPTEGTLSGTIQTSTGKITSSDADGDTRSYVATGLAAGASVSFAADGSFTYTTNISTATRHAAAKVGATAAQKNQTFTVTVKDDFLGSATPILVTVPIYAVNSAPTISGGKGGLTVTINTDDADGDGIDTNKNPSPGESGYTLSNGGTLVGILDVGLLYTTLNYPLTITVWDGYYVVTTPDPLTGLGGGRVTTTLSTGTKTWT